MTNKSMKNQILLTIILTLAASFIYAISSGIRNNYGIMFNAIIENTGLSYSYISLVLAFGQLFYGAIQPLCGILADKERKRVRFSIRSLFYSYRFNLASSLQISRFFNVIFGIFSFVWNGNSFLRTFNRKCCS